MTFSVIENQGGPTVSDDVNVIILPVNDPPIITDLDNVTIDEDGSVEMNLYATDVDEDTLTFSASSDTSAIITNVDGTNLTLTPEAEWNGQSAITVVVTDGSLPDTTSFVFTVTSVNDSPYLTLNSYTDTIAVDSPYAISLSAEDVDSDTLTFSIVNNPDWISLAGDEIQLLPDTVGVDTFQILVSDGELSDEEDYIITVVEPRPVITAISDVPDDQGGRVYIDFYKSIFDTDSLSRLETYQVERMDAGGWVGVGNYSAYGINIYTIEVNTLADSSSSTDGITVFRVIANMEEGNFASVPDSGYSVDNIAPGVPDSLSATATAENIVLTWSPNTEEDFQFYGIYRSTQDGFNPDTMISNTYSTANTNFTDSDVIGGTTYYYRISAFDHSGN
jgi:hypothetical protein